MRNPSQSKGFQSVAQRIPKVQGTIGFFVAFLAFFRAFDGALMLALIHI
jgi:hypothetical protein